MRDGTHGVTAIRQQRQPHLPEHKLQPMLTVRKSTQVTAMMPMGMDRKPRWKWPRWKLLRYCNGHKHNINEAPTRHGGTAVHWVAGTRARAFLRCIRVHHLFVPGWGHPAAAVAAQPQQPQNCLKSGFALTMVMRRKLGMT